MRITVFKDDLPNNLEICGDIAIDTETMGLNLLRDRLCLLQISDSNGEVYIVNFAGNYEAPNLKALLLDKGKTKIFHFARFDLSAIKHYLKIDLENIFCTKIASKLARTYTDSHSLKELCRELIGVSISKQQQASYWGREELSKEQLEYAAKDVLYLHKIRNILESMLIKENRLRVAKEVFDFLPTRVNLDMIGWADQDVFAH